MKVPWMAFSVVLLCGAWACRGTGGEDTFAVRDSAGVRIVESFQPAWDGEGGWRVGSDPLLRLGVLEGQESLQFNDVTGLARLDDGTVVVADGGSQEIRYFHSDGRLMALVGGPGEGPGEFSGLSGMGRSSGDGIWAYDFMLRRFTLLDGDGEVVDLITLDPQPPMLNAVGVLPDETLILKQLWAANTVAQATEAGLQRDPVAVVRVDSHGPSIDTVTMVAGREIYLWEEDGRGVMGTPPFGHNAVATPWGDGVAVGDQVAFEMKKYDPAGGLDLVARIPGRNVALGAGDLEEYTRIRLEGVPEERRPEARQNIQSMPVSATRPAYGGILSDAEGNLWVSEWVISPRLPRLWTVLDPSGRWLGEVETPRRFFPFAIGEDWILGVERDDLEVEYVVLHEILKGGTDGG